MQTLKMYFDKGVRSKLVKLQERITPSVLTALKSIELKYYRMFLEHQQELEKLKGITDEELQALLEVTGEIKNKADIISSINKKVVQSALTNDAVLEDNHRNINLEGEGILFNSYFELYKLEIIRDLILYLKKDDGLTSEELEQLSEEIHDNSFWNEQDIELLTAFFRGFRSKFQNNNRLHTTSS